MRQRQGLTVRVQCEHQVIKLLGAQRYGFNALSIRSFDLGKLFLVRTETYAQHPATQRGKQENIVDLTVTSRCGRFEVDPLMGLNSDEFFLDPYEAWDLLR